jgi:indolepyruvate ferredoxin oxidoreductase beta subunit
VPGHLSVNGHKNIAQGGAGMNQFNVFLIGVGGQGIGLLSEALLRAADHAGLPVRGVDTHGLAQRGGVVTSHLRVGQNIHSPLVRSFNADLVIALERDEALRGMNTMLKDGGTLVYYDASWQSLPVRLGEATATTTETIARQAAARGITVHRIFDEALPDVRMQNATLMAAVVREKLFPGVALAHVEQALDDLLRGELLNQNLAVLRRLNG